jgi:DNA-binding NtrC family response regulator
MTAAAPAESRCGILVVDDDAAGAWAVGRILERAGYAVTTAADAAAAWRTIRLRRPDAVITDIRMPGEDGITFAGRLAEACPGLPVLLMTAVGSLEVAVAALRCGAAGCLGKPIDPATFLPAVARLVGDRPLAAAVRPDRPAAPPVVAGDPAMLRALTGIAAALRDRRPLWVDAGTGQGASHVLASAARLLGRDLCVHDARLPGPLPAVPADALLVVDHADARPGLAAAALAGPAPSVVVGPLAGADADAAAPWRVALPALVDRRGDLPALVRALLAGAAERTGRRIAITTAAIERIAGHPWPGGVRELELRLLSAVALAPDGVVDSDHLDLPAGAPTDDPAACLDGAPGHAWRRWMDAQERRLIAAAMERHAGNQSAAARDLGIARLTLRRRLVDLGLSEAPPGPA